MDSSHPGTQWEITTYMVPEQPPHGQQAVLDTLHREKWLSRELKAKMLAAASAEFRHSIRSGKTYSKYSLEHKNAIVNMAGSSRKTEIARYCAQKGLDIPAESTVRSWKKSALPVTKARKVQLEVVVQKTGPRLALGEWVEKWVLEKCKRAFETGQRLANVTVRYVD